MLTLAPKGCDWLLIGTEGRLVYVNEYDKGLTAYEAWRASCLPCAFAEVETYQLTPFPLPFRKQDNECSAENRRETQGGEV